MDLSLHLPAGTDMATQKGEGRETPPLSHRNVTVVPAFAGVPLVVTTVRLVALFTLWLNTALVQPK
jgi:hypothetical protein